MNPLEGHGPHGLEDGGASVLPFVSSSILLVALLVGAVLFYLWRQGKLPFSAPVTASAEQAARQILAERMARGELSTEEFLERASMLNWTPGVEPAPRQRPKRLSS